MKSPNDCLAELELLDAVIYELVLFLLLPCLVPNALLPQRVSLSETYIPGHTLVQVPLHTVFLGKYPNSNLSGLLLTNA